MSSDRNPGPLWLELTFENCYDEVEKLQEAHTAETDGVKLVSGFHPSYGATVQVIIPPIGNGIMTFTALPMLFIPADELAATEDTIYPDATSV